MTAPVRGRWKRRWRASRWCVEAHFVREGEEDKGRAACGEFVGKQPAKGPPEPWTRMPPTLRVAKPCPECVKVMEGKP